MNVMRLAMKERTEEKWQDFIKTVHQEDRCVVKCQTRSRDIIHDTVHNVVRPTTLVQEDLLFPSAI